jgi:hypothetical protein
MITKGTRNKTLYNRASDLKKDGATFEQIERTIRYMNSTMMYPPVSEGHIKNLLRTVSKWFKAEAKHVH